MGEWGEKGLYSWLCRKLHCRLYSRLHSGLYSRPYCGLYSRLYYWLHSELYCVPYRRLYSMVYRRLYSGRYCRLSSRKFCIGGPSWMDSRELASCTSHYTLQTVHLVTEGQQLLQDQVSYSRRQGGTAGWAVRGRGGWLGKVGGPEVREVGGFKGLDPFSHYLN